MSKAFIFPYKVALETTMYWENKFPFKCYCKHGPCTLGDGNLQIPEDHTSVEVFSTEAEKFFKQFALAEEVDIFWERS